jgi:hypothetical protein
MTPPPPVDVVIYCPRCRTNGHGAISAEALAHIERGDWRIDCPLCGTATKVVPRKPARA